MGESFDTSVVLISTNQASIPDPEDPDGDPIPLKTHVRFDFYDIQGQWVDFKEFDFNNTARFEKYFSDESMLNLDRFGSGIAIGSVVITLDRDNVCGVYTYSQWNTFDPDEDSRQAPLPAHPKHDRGSAPAGHGCHRFADLPVHDQHPALLHVLWAVQSREQSR